MFQCRASVIALASGGDPVRIGGLQDQAVDAVALVFEIGEHAAVEFAGAGKLDPHRINEMPIH